MRYRKTELYTLLTTYQRNLANTLGGKRTWRNYARVLDKFLRMFPDRSAPDDVTRIDAEDYILYRQRAGIANNSINWELGVLRTFWNWMIDLEWASYNPFSRKAIPRTETIVYPLSEEVYETLLENGDAVDKAALSLCATSGLLPADMARLTWTNVSDQQAQKNGVVIPLRSEAMQLCNMLPKKGEKVFTIGIRALEARLRRLALRLGYQNVTFSRIRAMFVTRLFRLGTDPRLVAYLLGKKQSRFDWLPPLSLAEEVQGLAMQL